MNPHALVEQVFAAPLHVLHEAAHAVAAVLLDMPLVSVTADAAGNGLVALLTKRNNPRATAFTAVCYAVPACLYERFALPLHDCADDIDHVTVLGMEYERQTKGDLFATWTAARRLVSSASFGVGMERLVPVLYAHETLAGADVQSLLADLPRVSFEPSDRTPGSAQTLAAFETSNAQMTFPAWLAACGQDRETLTLDQLTARQAEWRAWLRAAA